MIDILQVLFGGNLFSPSQTQLPEVPKTAILFAGDVQGMADWHGNAIASPHWEPFNERIDRAGVELRQAVTPPPLPGQAPQVPPVPGRVAQTPPVPESPGYTPFAPLPVQAGGPPYPTPANPGYDPFPDNQPPVPSKAAYTPPIPTPRPTPEQMQTYASGVSPEGLQETVERATGVQLQSLNSVDAEDRSSAVQDATKNARIKALTQNEFTTKTSKPVPTPGKVPQAAVSDPYDILKRKLTYDSRISHIRGLNKSFQTRLSRFLVDAEKAGHNLEILSGYRSKAHQARLFKNAVKKYGSARAARKWVAPPGRSRHNYGRAVDLRYGDRGVGLGGKKTPAVKWAHANAHKYGLKFPMSWEDWHIELD